MVTASMLIGRYSYGPPITKNDLRGAELEVEKDLLSQKTTYRKALKDQAQEAHHLPVRNPPIQIQLPAQNLDLSPTKNQRPEFF